jgi:hypothetical protein
MSQEFGLSEFGARYCDLHVQSIQACFPNHGEGEVFLEEELSGRVKADAMVSEPLLYLLLSSPRSKTSLRPNLHAPIGHSSGLEDTKDGLCVH